MKYEMKYVNRGEQTIIYSLITLRHKGIGMNCIF